ncbi:hypothetical protein AVEN_87607-1 [Araneus ventricosus]|uniref:Uncharacterized protein n=1 Tax=Araneus ventricosus TaxID=182803 RepID=A0A4Y2LSZ5_ARAVE|nr:hypothetical protein AVEN_87607-1 [Araneus ventricosus]
MVMRLILETGGQSPYPTLYTSSLPSVWPQGSLIGATDTTCSATVKKVWFGLVEFTGAKTIFDYAAPNIWSRIKSYYRSLVKRSLIQYELSIYEVYKSLQQVKNDLKTR